MEHAQLILCTSEERSHIRKRSISFFVQFGQQVALGANLAMDEAMIYSQGTLPQHLLRICVIQLSLQTYLLDLVGIHSWVRAPLYVCVCANTSGLHTGKKISLCKHMQCVSDCVYTYSCIVICKPFMGQVYLLSPNQDLARVP